MKRAADKEFVLDAEAFYKFALGENPQPWSDNSSSKDDSEGNDGPRRLPVDDNK